ncbi:MAG TPA: glycerol-3-phosphate acyltransferase [Ktedonobacterales bacterium]|jgi:glycerol-3-phosphate acyltransferase PlsY
MDKLSLVVILGAYLIGSIPFSQIITRLRTGLKLYEVGEGNVGSRNVWHVVGPQWGVLALLLDCLKGYLVYWAATALVPAASAVLAGVAVVLGHQFSIFLRGRGGKGLAPALGVVLAISPLSTLCAVLILALAFLITRDFNPSVTVAIVAIILLPLLFRQPLWVPVYTLVLALLAALKKWLDHAHDTRVWNSHPWQGEANPGWVPPANQTANPSGDDPSAPNIHPN